MNTEKISSPTLANNTDDTPSAQVVSLRELSGNGSGAGLLDGNLGLISGVKVRVEVVVGSAELSIAQLFELKKDSVMPLEQLHNAPLAVRLEGKTIALGTLVVVGDNFGVHITEIMSPEAAASV
jgi:flagellar motor switch protein FliN/FliY